LTGARRSEVAGLHADHLQRDEAGLYADLHRKGDMRQGLLLTRRLEALLVDYVEANQPTGSLFPAWPQRQDGGEPLAVNSITNLVNATTRRILGRAVSPHGLRRTFVTLALAGGASLAEVQRYVGHESPTTTMQYAEDVIDRKKSAAEFLFDEKREV